MKNFILLFFLLFTTLFAFSQEKKYDKTITLSELENILRNNNEHITINNTYIKFDAEIQWSGGDALIVGKDAKFLYKVYDDEGGLIGVKRKNIENIIKKDDISFYNCKFEIFPLENCHLNRLYFSECEIIDFTLEKCELDYLGLDVCEIKEFKLKNSDVDEIDIWRSKFTGNQCYLGENTIAEMLRIDMNAFNQEGFILIHKNNLKGGLFIGGKYIGVAIGLNKVNKYVGLKVESKEVEIDNNQFIIDSTFSRKIDKSTYIQDTNYYRSFININRSLINQLTIKKNQFLFEDKWNLKENTYNYYFNSSSFEEFTISNEVTERINFNNSNISKKLTFDSLIINKSFSAENFDIPDYNINFTWDLFKTKLVFFINDSTQYNPLKKEDIANLELYNEYISTLNKFLTVFKNRGDLKSANACYVEMKDAETRRLKYLYETEGGTENYLNYNLNKFLKYFAEYGTSPVRSVQISGWVILIFACFYFFFYSDWDKINRKFLINRGEKLLSYFRSEQKLEELYSDNYKEDISTYFQFKQNLKDSKTEVPFFFMLFLKPIYWFSVIKYQFSSFLYKRIEFLQGKWIDLTTGRKIVIGFATFMVIVTYGTYLVVVRSLNSLILSINTFTTLGFGDIPVVGLSRYVAILEGFLGWFLLSIFSVSLISQILQN